MARADPRGRSEELDRLGGARPRRWRWVAIGAVLIAGGAMAALAAVEAVDERDGVVVVTEDLPAGHVLAGDDLRVAQVAGEDIEAIAAVEAEALVGQRLAVPVRAGTVLPEAALGPVAEHLDASDAVVGAALAAGDYPVSLRPGAAVALVLGAGDSVPARVHTIDHNPDQGGAVVELVVAAADAAAVARAAGAEELSVVQVAGEGE